ncbi:hypothetical protein V3C99_015125, partial [Haemonchus contortus]
IFHSLESNGNVIVMRTAIIALSLLIVRDVVASFLRVESGHQWISIDGRDPYMGFFTRLQFHEPTCIRSLTVHCLKPLTGAEEIDILFSECKHGHWKIMHYTNTKEKFILKKEVVARQLSISSPVALSIIDVQVETCSRNSTIPVDACRPPRVHPRRHGKQFAPVHVRESERTRRKRSIQYILPDVYRNESSPYEIPLDVLIPVDRTVVIQPGVVLRFADDAGFTVQGVLIANGTKSAPVTFEPQTGRWKGIEIVNASVPSVFRFANVTGSKLGITVKSGTPPSIEDVISSSNHNGFDIQTNSSVRIVNSSALDNENTGFRISSKGDVWLESCLSASNRGDGFYIETVRNVSILDSHAFSNSRHGITLIEAASAIRIERSAASSNGANGIRISKWKKSGKELIVEIIKANITGHYYAAAVHFENATNLRFTMGSCLIEDNFNKGIVFEGATVNSTISTLNSNFTQNRGSTISLSLVRDSDVVIKGNQFTTNHLNDFGEHEAVIKIATFAETTGSKISIMDNSFEQNAMNNVVELRHLGGKIVPILLEKNNFMGNLAQSVVNLDVPRATVRGNYFSNVQSSCEITRAAPSHADVEDNYWGHEKEINFLPKICALNRSLNYEVFEADSSDGGNWSVRPTVPLLAQPKAMAEPAQRQSPVEFIRTTTSRAVAAAAPLKPFENTYNQVKANPQPYSVSSEVAVYPGQIVIVDPGTQFELAPGIGFTVQEKGKLYLNGTADQPIRLFGESTWRGVVVKPGGTLVLNHAIIEGASIGLWIDSEKVQVENARIVDSVVHGVEITANAADDVDLGDSVIERPKGSGIGVDERKGSLRIRNVAIKDGWGSGIDFISPAENIRIENVSVTNGSSYSIHVVEFPLLPLKSLKLQNVSVTDQTRGHAGVLVSSGWVEQIDIDQSFFARNTVPSLIIGVECHEQMSHNRLRNTTFVSNQDTVANIDVGECGSAGVEGNRFEGNNNDGRNGVLMMNASPRVGSSSVPIVIEKNEFVKNGGEYSVMLSMQGPNAANGSFRANQLRDNINSVASVVLTSPYYRVDGNQFANPLSAHELDVRSNGSWKLQAADNDWVTSDMTKAIKAPEGSLEVPRLQLAKKPESPTPDNGQCSHLKYCSGVGTCTGGVCVCPADRIGLDCSIMIGCPGNCSGNGVCDILNKCICYDGWTSADCSTPICRFDCHGHGKCVSRDECECNAGWSGEFCDQIGCVDGSCLHGTCLSSKCQCEEGWRGSRCSFPICQNCSINGRCVAPNQCQCFGGYQGEDCSICRGPVCQTCDFDCVHGTCERETRTCSCSRGWSGAACDICRSGNCQVKSSVLYILPSTADREDTNVVVNVFGVDFPKTPSQLYTCIFGASYSEGRRISSSVVRCRVPKDLNLGRHLFNLAPEGSISVIPNFDVRPIHFTVFDSCTPVLCKGVCIGPLCVCPKGTTGINCEIIEIIPSIDWHFIENQKASVAFEGTPYLVVLPTMPGSLHRVNSTIDGIQFDSSRGIIAWDEPLGSNGTYEITVTSSSLSGSSSISWKVAVEPSYTAEVTAVEKQPGTSALTITGMLRHVKGNFSAPVKLWIKRRDQEEPRQIIIRSNGDSFSYDFIPDDSGAYTVVASHPGMAPISAGVAFDVPPLHFPIDTSATGALVRNVEQCDAVMLRPPNGTVNIERIEDSYAMEQVARGWTEETVSLLRCDGKRELWRNQLSALVPNVIAVPSAIALPIESVQSKIFEVVIHRMGVHLRPPLKLTSSDNTQPVFVISTFPDIDQITSDTKYDKIKVAFGQNADHKDRKNTSLLLVADEEVVFRIPLLFIAPVTKFDVSICVKDSYDYGAATQETAVLSVSNTALGVDIVKSNLPLNKEFASFSLVEGFYQIVAKAPNHRTISEVAYISPLNTSFCVAMQAIDPRSLLTIGEEGVSVMEVKATNLMRTPYVELHPPSLNQSNTRVLATVTGSTSGLISIDPFEDDVFILKPSARSVGVNTSFWIGVEWEQHLATSESCDAYVVPLPYLFLPDGSTDIQRMAIDFIVVANNAPSPTRWKVCDESNRPRPIALRTRVACDCSQGARATCRRKYKSAAACGSAWKRIADDTVSLEVLSTFLLLLTDCQTVHVNMTELDEAMQCISSLESECPILHRRLKRDVDAMAADGPADVINHMSTMQNQISGVSGPMGPLLNALNMQSIRMASLYSEFIQRLQKMFPPSLTTRMTGEVVDRFLRSVADNSELGLGISAQEANEIGDDELVGLWNSTVYEWTSGQMDTPGETEGISFADVKQLIVTADRLQSLTRQNGASDPFSLLHEYIGQILTTNDSGDEECMRAAVYIEPLVIYEDSSVTIDVYIENLQDSTLTNIDLSIEFVRNDMFVPRIDFGVGPSWSAGINTMNGFGVLGPRSSFEVHWTRKIITENRLTSTAFYQAVIVLGFHKDGVPSKQRLKSPLMEIRPRRSLRLLHFVSGDITASPKKPFSAMTAIMNTGYSSLTNVQVVLADFDIVTSSQAAPFDIVRMELDGKQIGTSISPEVGDIASGTSKRLTYHITTPGQEANIVNMSAIITVEGILMPVEDQHIYAIRAAVSEKDGFIVSPVTDSEPLFFYRPDIGSIINIVPLEHVASHQKPNGEPRKITLLTSFRSLVTPGFTGALWGTFKLPELPSNYRLMRVVDQRGTRLRVANPVTWIEENGEDRNLNFIDSAAPFPVTDIVYEMEFGEPTESSGPEFDQTSYRVQIFPDSWPEPGYPFAVISSHSPASSNVTYALYTPDNEKSFAVDPYTGELFLTSSVPPGDEFCTLLVAKDAKGRETAVPVAINTGGLRKECINFDNTYLSPSVYHGPHRGSIGSWATKEPTRSTESGEPTMYTVSPDRSPATLTTRKGIVATVTATGVGSEGLPTRSTMVPSGFQSETSTTFPDEPSSHTSTEGISISSYTKETPLKPIAPGAGHAGFGTTSEGITFTATTLPEAVEPTHPIPISPDASLMTVSSFVTAVTDTAEEVVTITPDSHLPEITTAGESFPSPVPSLFPESSTELPTDPPIWDGSSPESIPVEVSTGESIINVTPDSSPETPPPVTLTLEPEEPFTRISSNGNSQTVSFVGTPGTGDWATEPSGLATTAKESVELIHTMNPEGGATEPQWPTVIPPVWTPVGGGGTLATYQTTARPTRTTLDPYYGMACAKQGEPIWDLICELSKASIRREP